MAEEEGENRVFGYLSLRLPYLVGEQQAITESLACIAVVDWRVSQRPLISRCRFQKRFIKKSRSHELEKADLTVLGVPF